MRASLLGTFALTFGVLLFFVGGREALGDADNVFVEVVAVGVIQSSDLPLGTGDSEWM